MVFRFNANLRCKRILRLVDIPCFLVFSVASRACSFNLDFDRRVLGASFSPRSNVSRDSLSQSHQLHLKTLQI